MLTQYNYILKNNSQESSKIYTDYPSLYRVYEAVNFIFSHFIETTKHIVREEELFLDIIKNIIVENEEYEDIEDFKQEFYLGIISVLNSKMEEQDSPNISDIIKLLNITTNAYLRLSDKQLFNQRSIEKKLQFKDFDVTDSIFEDLIEAEKGLISIMTQDEILKFRELSTKIKVRNE